MTSYSAAPFDPAAADDRAAELTARRFLLWLLARPRRRGAAPRTVPARRPAVARTVGIVWHDEGAWVHNARNGRSSARGRLDTLEPDVPARRCSPRSSTCRSGCSASGCGRHGSCPKSLGFLAVLLLGRRGARRSPAGGPALVAAALLATNYVWVMWNRAALMESDDGESHGGVAVRLRACRTERRRWGLAAGALRCCAFFTKAAAAFFLAALALASAAAARAGERVRGRPRRGAASPPGRAYARRTGRRGSRCRWRCSSCRTGRTSASTTGRCRSTRKPSYTLRRRFVDRASWLPGRPRLLHADVGACCCSRSAGCSRTVLALAASDAGRAPVRFLDRCSGVAELFLHDVGNERRLVFLIPPLVGLAAMVLAQQRRLLAPTVPAACRGRNSLVAALVVVYGVVSSCAGPWVRLAFIYQVRPGVHLVRPRPGRRARCSS